MGYREGVDYAAPSSSSYKTGRTPNNAEIRIIRAEKGDALEFYRLEAECFEMEGNDEDTTYYWTPILSYQCCYKAVADGSKIVGGVVSMPTFDKRWYVNSLFVHPKHRMRGIARALMGVVFSVAWHDEMILDVKTDRPHLVRFYESLGFKMAGRSPNHYQDGEDRFHMVRKTERSPVRRLDGQSE